MQKRYNIQKLIASNQNCVKDELPGISNSFCKKWLKLYYDAPNNKEVPDFNIMIRTNNGNPIIKNKKNNCKYILIT